MEREKACAILEKEAAEGKLDGKVVKCLVDIVSNEREREKEVEEPRGAVTTVK
jgi:HD-GYP domain-containing protein (c-di-GMP phosphodiesterase class II)